MRRPTGNDTLQGLRHEVAAGDHRQERRLVDNQQMLILIADLRAKRHRPFVRDLPKVIQSGAGVVRRGQGDGLLPLIQHLALDNALLPLHAFDGWKAGT